MNANPSIAMMAVLTTTAVKERLRKVLMDAGEFYAPIALLLKDLTNYFIVPTELAKGKMLTHYSTQTVSVDPTALYPGQQLQEQCLVVDITSVAQKLHFWRKVNMDAEAFGVLVTRRPCTDASDLLEHEATRLLAVLVEAKEFMGQVDAEAKQFEIAAIPSDARDGKARTFWCELASQNDAYLITLADI